jgi:prophage regulatory protein
MDKDGATKEFLNSTDLEQLTGTPASTWRYWAHIGSGPESFKIGRRRVWKRSTAMAWLEAAQANGDCAAQPGADGADAA